MAGGQTTFFHHPSGPLLGGWVGEPPRVCPFVRRAANTAAGAALWLSSAWMEELCIRGIPMRWEVSILFRRVLQDGEGLLNFNSWRSYPRPRANTAIHALPGSAMVSPVSLGSPPSPWAYLSQSRPSPIPVPIACWPGDFAAFTEGEMVGTTHNFSRRQIHVEECGLKKKKAWQILFCREDFSPGYFVWPWYLSFFLPVCVFSSGSVGLPFFFFWVLGLRRTVSEGNLLACENTISIPHWTHRGVVKQQLELSVVLFLDS